MPNKRHRVSWFWWTVIPVCASRCVWAPHRAGFLGDLNPGGSLFEGFLSGVSFRSPFPRCLSDARSVAVFPEAAGLREPLSGVYEMRLSVKGLPAARSTESRKTLSAVAHHCILNASITRLFLPLKLFLEAW